MDVNISSPRPSVPAELPSRLYALLDGHAGQQDLDCESVAEHAARDATTAPRARRKIDYVTLRLTEIVMLRVHGRHLERASCEF
jgi:hypothetical protein